MDSKISTHNLGNENSQKEMMSLWREMKALMHVCGKITAVSEDTAKQNRTGFIYDGKFILY